MYLHRDKETFKDRAGQAEVHNLNYKPTFISSTRERSR